MKAEQLSKISLEEYLKIEKETETKYEFHDGTLIAMAGGTIEHGLISGNTFMALGLALRTVNENCRPINSEVKLYIASLKKYLYPDGMVICGDIERSNEHQNAIENPIIIIEVLSKSTEGYDRGDKFFFYKQIPSLQEYILIDQHNPRIDLYTRKSDLWKITRTEGLEKSVSIASLNIQIALKEVYRDVFKPG